eukprot:764635-Hanusia_phi.AAC.5
MRSSRRLLPQCAVQTHRDWLRQGSIAHYIGAIADGTGRTAARLSCRLNLALLRRDCKRD